MPQMKNLSGSVSAEAKGSMEVFPDVLRQRAFAYGGSGGSGQGAESPSEPFHKENHQDDAHSWQR